MPSHPLLSATRQCVHPNLQEQWTGVAYAKATRTEAARLRLVLSSILQTFNLHSFIAKGTVALTVQPHSHRPLLVAPLILRYDIANTLYACFDFPFDTPVDGSTQLLS